MNNPMGVLALNSWSEAEARERFARLCASGWSISQIARMFGIELAEAQRLLSDSVSVSGGHAK